MTSDHLGLAICLPVPARHTHTHTHTPKPPPPPPPHTHIHRFSVDHADLFVCSDAYLESHAELAPLMRGLPHSLVFVNSNDEPHVLMPLDRVPRPNVMR
jgi:hypothetical protein